jgi:xanthine dehydrogenase large subunit
MNMDTSTPRSRTEISGGAHTPRKHDSAHKHVTGTADYIDDMPEPAGTLHGYLGLTDRAHARITSLDLDAVRACEGVVAVLTGADVPGVNDISPSGRNDEPVLATEKVLFYGQPVFAVIAETRELARRAAKKAVIGYEDLPHVTDVRAAMDADYPLVTRPAEARARRYRGRSCRSTAQAQGRDADRRAGSFLSRRPYRLRHSRRG